MVIITLFIFVSCSASNNYASEDMGIIDSDSKSEYDGLTGGSPSLDATEPSQNQEFERKIIKTVNIYGETKKFDDTIADISSYVDEFNGYIENYSLSGQSYNYYGSRYSRNAEYTLRIPAEELDSFLNRLEGRINIVKNQASIDDISAQYYDIVSRLETLEAEKNALVKMYEQADTIEYMLKVQERLYNVIEEIEAYNTRIKYFDGKVAYSTVNLSISEVVEYTEIHEKESWGERLGDAFKDSWVDFGKNFQSFSVWFVGAIPTIITIGFIAGIVSLVVALISRKARKKSKKG